MALVSLFVDFWWLVNISLRMSVLEEQDGAAVSVSLPLFSGLASNLVLRPSSSQVLIVSGIAFEGVLRNTLCPIPSSAVGNYKCGYSTSPDV